MFSIPSIRVAIVGAGPGGFFAAGELFKQLGDGVRVDVIDQLPVPYGLVRYGVAPDHPRTRRVIRQFEAFARAQNFSFLGNVAVGRDVTVEELRSLYDAVILATGAEKSRDPEIPGTQLPGFHHAIDMVRWYNGHPDYRDYAADFSCERAVVIGNGNVALDIARMLIRNPEELRSTDIAKHALEALAESRIREIHILGRRGPAQNRFTAPVLSELASLPGVSCVAHSDELVLNEESRREMQDAHEIGRKRALDVLQSFAMNGGEAGQKRVVFRFLLSPLDVTGPDRVTGVRCRRNRLEGEPRHQRAVPTPARETLDCGMVVSCIGYRGEPVPGLPFDHARGVLPHRQGRVLQGSEVIKGVYATGWIKQGGHGLIGHLKPDAVETVRSVMEDLNASTGERKTRSSEVGDLSEILLHRGKRVISYAEWKTIDEAEIRRGVQSGKIRENYTSWEELLSAAGA